jgi:uncharacterized protein YbjT (DUF2867 family)
MKKAIVIGATGLTGRHITKKLLASTQYSKVITFTRKSLGYRHPKLVSHIVDFEAMPDWADLVRGDDLFAAMGTTLSQAGSKAAQYRVDYTYQAGVMEAAAKNGVARLFLVSSPNASTRSPFFYSRMKAELDAFAESLPFSTRVYFRPAIILGDRPDNRLGEKLGGLISEQLASWVPGMQKYKPIKGKTLAQAIVNCACGKLPQGTHHYELDEIFELV